MRQAPLEQDTGYNTFVRERERETGKRIKESDEDALLEVRSPLKEIPTFDKEREGELVQSMGVKGAPKHALR